VVLRGAGGKRAKKWQGRLSRKQSIALPKVVNARGLLTVNRARDIRRGGCLPGRGVNGPLRCRRMQERRRGPVAVGGPDLL